MIKFFLLAAGVTSVLLSVFEYLKGKFSSTIVDVGPTTGMMYKVAGLIRAGGYSCLNAQYSNLLYFLPPVCILLLYYQSYYLAGGILAGAAAGLICVYYTLEIALSGNIATAVQAMTDRGLENGFGRAYSAGRMTGLFIIGAGLMIVSSFFFIAERSRFMYMIGVSLGASCISIFARLAGGVFTKAADVSADLVGKVFHDIPEDSPENPGVIADNIGDNIGDCVGTAADIFETYVCGFMAATMLFNGLLDTGRFVAVVSSTIGPIIAINLTGGIKLPEAYVSSDRGVSAIMNVMTKMVLGSVVSSFAIFASITFLLSKDAGLMSTLVKSVPFVIGIIFPPAMLMVATYYTSRSNRPVKQMAESCNDGGSMNIIMGYAVSLESAFALVMTVMLLAVIPWFTGGIEALAVTILTALGFISAIMTMDAYGPVVDNAGGIVTMSGAKGRGRHNTDILDSIGNLTKALTKGYASGVTMLTSFLLISLYIRRSGIGNGTALIGNGLVMFGLFLGAALPFLFSGFVVKSVHNAANYMLKVISYRIKNDNPDTEHYYTQPIQALAKKSVDYMLYPMLTISIPFIIHLILRLVPSLGSYSSGYMVGILFGVASAGVCLGTLMTIGGAAWDNAKKLVEENVGGSIDAAKRAVEESITNFNKIQSNLNMESRESADFDLKSVKIIQERIKQMVAVRDIAPDQRLTIFDNLVQGLETQSDNLSKWIASHEHAITRYKGMSAQRDIRHQIDVESAIKNIKNMPSSERDMNSYNGAFLTIFDRYSVLEALRSIKDAAVMGDTFGDPLKDAAGTSLNAMIKMTAILALLISLMYG